MIKTYSELIKIPTYIERYRYLRINSSIGEETFGFRRYVNQYLYKSDFWKDFKFEMVERDNCCDLAMEGHEIVGSILLHHINPITYDDIVLKRSCVFDPENVVCTVLNTHNAIHYGSEVLLTTDPIVRLPNDTCPWRK